MMSAPGLRAKVPAGLLLLLPHLLEATAHAHQLGAVPGHAATILSTAGAGLRDTGQLDTSRPVLDRALAIAQEHLGPDHLQTLSARRNLAAWLDEAGQPAQAADQYRDLLADYLWVPLPFLVADRRGQHQIGYPRKYGWILDRRGKPLRRSAGRHLGA
jgi:hypothetical protein